MFVFKEYFKTRLKMCLDYNLFIGYTRKIQIVTIILYILYSERINHDNSLVTFFFAVY